MNFVDLEKIYYRVPSEPMWWVLENKQVSCRYIDVIKDVYNRAQLG